MRDETQEKPAALRSGYTTGACATATSCAAASLLLTGDALTCYSITLPKGQHVEFAIDYCLLDDDTSSATIQTSTQSSKRATASTIKDAGDDPDVTHGATVFSSVELKPEPGVCFFAADGVGTVTKAGLSIAVGEPAINPVPRKMIASHLEKLASQHEYSGGFDVHVGVKNGKQIATKTMNGRLGILGGLSILGTTGIVRPFSCSAYIASIHQGIDVALCNGESHLFACTGNKSEEAAERIFSSDNSPVDDSSLIEMGDFIGAVLKHVRKITAQATGPTAGQLTTPLERLSIVGGFGKLSKFAQGHLDLHSKTSSVDFEFLADLAKSHHISDADVDKVRQANTSIETLSIVGEKRSKFANALCQLGVAVARKYIPEPIQIDVIAIDRQSFVVGVASSSLENAKQIMRDA